MDAREERGRTIAENVALQRNGDGPYWVVPSQSATSGNAKHLVDTEERTCTCPDFEEHKQPCKHVYAVEYTIQRQTNANGETTVTEALRVTYRQDWPAYNDAQTHEKERVALLLRDLCDGIDSGVQGRDRPRYPLSDGVFAAVMKVYGTTSGRRAMTDMRHFEAKGLIAKAPCYNSIFKVLENPAITALLKAMVTESAMPLKAVETDFAIDSSGFSTSTYARWYSAKYGREMSKNKWLKAHVMVGVKTNAIVSVEISGGPDNDAPHLAPVFQCGAKAFNVERVSPTRRTQRLRTITTRFKTAYTR